MVRDFIRMYNPFETCEQVMETGETVSQLPTAEKEGTVAGRRSREFLFLICFPSFPLIYTSQVYGVYRECGRDGELDRPVVVISSISLGSKIVLFSSWSKHSGQTTYIWWLCCVCDPLIPLCRFIYTISQENADTTTIQAH